jgi:hypothetical protein
MNELMKILGQTGQTMTFDQIKIQMASPEQIRSWSYGEIKKPVWRCSIRGRGFSSHLLRKGGVGEGFRL